MKIKLSDFVAQFLYDRHITQGFTVVGGGAMHLNDSLGHKDGLNILYCHHEQSCSIAAESYARNEIKPAFVNVTTGPGGINALNGVACAYLDSLPMFVISGQVRYDTTIAYAKKHDNASPRSVGDQEFDIVSTVKHMTKYAVMIEDPTNILYHLEKAYYLMMHGRKGPVWIDIPINFQAEIIETDTLKSYLGSEEHKNDILENEPAEVNDATIEKVLGMIKDAKRPVIYAGYGIRLSSGYDIFKKVIDKLNIPVVTYWNAIDLIETENDLYIGRGGNMGDRAGNFAIECSDLIIAIGTRLSIRQVGYNYKLWAKNSKVIMVDIDKEEFKKHTIHVDLAIHADAKDFLEKLYTALETNKNNVVASKLAKPYVWAKPYVGASTASPHISWLNTCNNWKQKYPVVDKSKYNKDKAHVNVYAFIDYLSRSLPDDSMTVVSNGACCVAGSQAYYIKNGTRFHNNSAIASMGYGLPASIGACLSTRCTRKGEPCEPTYKNTVCLEGDGSIMMNLQELQTIASNKLPIKIFLINNNGYHSIRITQNNIFKEHTKVGIGPESGDLSFPEFKKIADAFNIPYQSAKTDDEMKSVIDKVVNESGPMLVEIFTDTNQVWEPKSSGKKAPDGTITSPPLYDMEPFLPDEEINEIIKISKS